MPSEATDQGGVPPSRHCEENSFKAEKHIDPWKSNALPDQRDVSISALSRDQVERQGSGIDGFSKWSSYSPALMDSISKPLPSLHMQPPSDVVNGINGICHLDRECSLFSSSLSELFSPKLRLLKNNDLTSQPADTVGLNHDEEEPFESLEEIEAQTIGNLLPDEDDLLSGVIGHNSYVSSTDDFEDFDLFSSGGGMELEGEGLSSAAKKMFNAPGRVSNGLGIGEHLLGQQPSRTLLVRNISNHAEDSELKALFEQHGDIQTLYTAGKYHHGFVMVSYYDIRAAQHACRSLQSRSLRGGKLDIRYATAKENLSKEMNQGALLVSNLDCSISNDELHKIFSAHGQIKEIYDITNEKSRRFIEYYDVRSAEAALSALNKMEITGKKIKLEPCCTGVVRSFRQLHNHDELHSFNNLSSHMSMISSGVIASSSMNGGPIQVLHNPARSPVNSFIGAHRSASIPIDFPSQARVTSVGKPVDSQEAIHSLDEIKSGSQCNPHSHSFPEYHDSFASGSPYKTSRTFAEMVCNGLKMNEGFNNQSFNVVHSNGNQAGFNTAAFMPSGNGSMFHGNKHIWSNSNSQPQLSSSHMIWPHSPSGVSGFHALRLQPVTAYPRAPPMMVNAGSPINHHIGSVPGRNPAFWERRNAYVAGSPESSGFHIGSHGSVGYPCGSPSHPMEIPHQNIIGNVGGARTPATNAALHSPQQMCHLFPGRNPLMAMPASFDASHERFRGLSHRRIDTSSNNADKKQYELDISRIMRGEDNRTTLMIKNIPNKYTSKMLLAAIDEHCKGTYDFIYLPIDFKNKCNVGYAFINMIDPQKIIPFYKAFNGKKWEKFNSEKVASLAYARIQGKAALIAHFQNSSLMNEDKRCRPILFHTDGPNAGDQEPFPMGTNIRSRPGKPRFSSSEEAPNGADS